MNPIDLPKAWYVIGNRHLATRAARKSRAMVPVRRFGRNWVLWKDPRAGWVLQEDKCAHRSAALSRGKLVQRSEGLCARCPFHGYDFDAQGVCVHAPEIKRGAPGLRIETFPVVEAQDFFWVGWKFTADEAQKHPTPWFEELDKRYTYSSSRHLWKVHFTRSVESQLDYAHLPFVHARNIGRGFDPSRAVTVVADAQHIRVTIDPRIPSYFELRMGNLWKLNITEQMKQVLAFVPIDAENTQILVRTYHSFVRWPILRHVVAWALAPFNFYILKQDRDVVSTQHPRDVREARAEKLMPSDKAIVAFRNWVGDTQNLHPPGPHS